MVSFLCVLTLPLPFMLLTPNVILALVFLSVCVFSLLLPA